MILNLHFKTVNTLLWCFQEIFFPLLLTCPHNLTQFTIQEKRDIFLVITHTSGTAAFISLQERIFLNICTEIQINNVRNEEFKIMLDILQVWSIMEIYLENYFFIFNIPHSIFHSIIGRHNQSRIHQTTAEYFVYSKSKS